jgi:hypothetical protein
MGEYSSQGCRSAICQDFLWRVNKVISDYFWIPKMEQELNLVKCGKSSQETWILGKYYFAFPFGFWR